MNITAVDWLILLGIVAVLLTVDLLAATLRPHAVGFREAALWSVFFVAVAAGFGFLLAALEGWGYAGQYFAGYLVEKSLSVDNLFVFVIIMTSFAVPREHQQRVLIFGIIASLIMRAAFIAAGAALLSALSFMFLIFGLVLVWTAFRLATHRGSAPDVTDSGLVRAARRLLPDVKALLIDERVEGFFRERFNDRGERVGTTQHDTLDEAMWQANSEYLVSDWRLCPEDVDPVQYLRARYDRDSHKAIGGG